ncbi:MAG: rplS [Candidatus Berkelbacteria bacterium]|nr:rplS [Candidatus Berkelbacteria bacterium]
MIVQDLTKLFGKKNIPEIRPGDTVRVSFKVTEGSKTRIQNFEGICLAKKHGNSLDGSFSLRKISGGIGVERTFPIHSPLVTKIEKIKSRKVHQAKLYFIRDLVGKKTKKVREEKDYKMWEEALTEEEIAKIEEEKRLAAEQKAAKKAKVQEELDKKFASAAAAHEQVASGNEGQEDPKETQS